MIYDLDYLDSMPETSAMYLNGSSSAIGMSDFSSLVRADSTYTDTVLIIQTITAGKSLFASNYLSTRSIGSGKDALIITSTSSLSIASGG